MYTAPIPADDEQRVATLRSYGILDTLPEPKYDDVTALATLICDAPYSTITFVDSDRQWFKSEVGLGATETGRADGICACAVLTPEPMVIEDTQLDARFCANPFVLDGPRIRFYAGAPLIAPNGHVLGTICVFDDKPRKITVAQVEGLKALARQVMSLLDARLRYMERERVYSALMESEKIAAVGRLASSIAHEINNPLEAVTNLLFLARSRAIHPDVVEWLAEADTQLKRVSIITNQTLRFHKQASRPQAVTCLSIFSATLDLYEARLRNAKIQVEKRKRANAPVVCFEGDIRQVISNVIRNSIDAMPFGGRLLLRSREATNWKTGERGLALTVADTGTGISPEDLQRSFHPFFTTKDIKSVGLGLWISREIARRHNGTIRLRSKSDRNGRSGTVVTLFVPFMKQPEEWNPPFLMTS